MRNIWIIATREFRKYFISPVAYAVAAMIFLVLGVIFYSNLGASILNQYAPDGQAVLAPLATLLLFGVPAITMRLIADESRSGTIELLLTAPVRDAELVVDGDDFAVAQNQVRRSGAHLLDRHRGQMSLKCRKCDSTRVQKPTAWPSERRSDAAR